MLSVFRDFARHSSSRVNQPRKTCLVNLPTPPPKNSTAARIGQNSDARVVVLPQEEQTLQNNAKYLPIRDVIAHTNVSVHRRKLSVLKYFVYTFLSSRKMLLDHDSRGLPPRHHVNSVVIARNTHFIAHYNT